jgi:hypothetical protein
MQNTNLACPIMDLIHEHGTFLPGNTSIVESFTKQQAQLDYIGEYKDVRFQAADVTYFFGGDADGSSRLSAARSGRVCRPH